MNRRCNCTDVCKEAYPIIKIPKLPPLPPIDDTKRIAELQQRIQELVDSVTIPILLPEEDLETKCFEEQSRDFIYRYFEILMNDVTHISNHKEHNFAYSEYNEGDDSVGIQPTPPLLHCSHCDMVIEFTSSKMDTMYRDWEKLVGRDRNGRD